MHSDCLWISYYSWRSGVTMASALKKINVMLREGQEGLTSEIVMEETENKAELSLCHWINKWYIHKKSLCSSIINEKKSGTRCVPWLLSRHLLACLPTSFSDTCLVAPPATTAGITNVTSIIGVHWEGCMNLHHFSKEKRFCRDTEAEWKLVILTAAGAWLPNFRLASHLGWLLVALCNVTFEADY